MKKSLLFLCFILIASLSGAQSFQLSSVVTSIAGDRDSLLHSTAVVHNISGNTIDVRVDKTIENLGTNHYSYFCWAGQCYNQTTTTSPFTTTMAPGDSSIAGTLGFIAYLQPVNTVGTSDVTYCFYDDLNPGDSVCITFNYFAIITGIREMLASGVALTNPVPNPSNGFTQIGFNLTNSKNAKIVIYNVLGLSVREVRVSDKQKLVSLNTADLKSGMYIYSLYNDEKLIASKKLIVSHK